ncbi:MAG: ATP-binding protein, partial [Thermoleophilaceae bacterium]
PQPLTPYEAVAELLTAAGAPAGLEAALERSSMSPARRDVVAREVAALLRPNEARSASARDVAAEREGRFVAWTEALDALTGPAATWIVEDVHWSGGDLLAFLAVAGSATSTGRRLIVASARPSLLDAAPDWVAGAELIHLAPLAQPDAGELVRALVGDALPDRLVVAIAERSDGNPLFIEELLRTWISVGTLVRADDGWSLSIAPDEVLLPPTVQAIYAAQLDDLPSDARAVARRASVAGRRFADAALAPLELDDRRDGLEVLRRRAFVAGPQRDPIEGDIYAYRHALLRDAGYASLARAERARLHVALARWLEANAGAGADAVAEAIGDHYAHALENLPGIAAGVEVGLGPTALAAAAADWLERAAETSLALAAHEGAADLLHRSMALTRDDASLDFARRRLRRGEILADAADLDAGIGEIETAMAAFEKTLPEAAGGYARAAYALGLAYMQQIRFPETETLTRAAIERLAASGADEPAGTSRLMALHAWAVSAQGRDDGALDEVNRASALAAEVGDPTLELEVLEHRTATRDELDDVDPAAWEELGRRAVALGRWRQAVIAARISATMSAEHAPRTALSGLDAAAEMAQAHAMTEQGGWCDLARSETLWVVGDWSAALEAGLRAVSLGERYGYTRLTFRTWMVLLPLLAARGDGSLLERHATWWATAMGHFPSSPSPYGRALSGATAAWVALARGNPPPVPDEGLVEAAVPFSNPHFLAAIETLVDAWLRAGRLDPARAVAARAVDDDATPLMRVSAALLRAWVARADGDDAAAVREARSAAAGARSIGAAWWLSRGLRAAGDSAEATEIERSLGITPLR